MKTGVAIRRIILKNLKQIEVQYPKSLPEQQRIVAILDQAFAAIAKARSNAEQNLKNAKELFDSYLQSVFDPSTRSGQEGEGWEEKALAQISKTFGRGKSKHRPRNWEGLTLRRQLSVYPNWRY